MDRPALLSDLEKFATKEDLEKFATKADLEKYATKEDLEKYATKEDLKRELDKRFDDLDPGNTLFHAKQHTTALTAFPPTDKPLVDWLLYMQRKYWLRCKRD